MHTHTDREGAAGLGRGHSVLLLWPIDSGLVLHFGHNAGLCTKYTHAHNYLPTQIHIHTFIHSYTHTSKQAEVKQCRCSEKERLTAAHALLDHLLSKPLSQTTQLCMYASPSSPLLDSPSLSLCFNVLSFSARSAVMTSHRTIHTVPVITINTKQRRCIISTTHRLTYLCSCR